MAPVRDDGMLPRPDHTQTMTTGFSGDVAPARLVVRVVEGPDRGRFLPIGDATVVVGASESADLSLHDPGVSRRHLEIAVVDGGVRVVDLKSKNGTLLYGARLDTAVVKVGAEIVLGRTTLRIDDADAAADQSEADTLGGLSTKATAMRRCFGVLARVAPTDVSVLLEGEPGVGHGLVARAIHASSARAARAFRAVSLSALKRDEVALALFGRGASTDATGAGAFELAHGGTLYLEDVDVAPAPVQAPLARALESGNVARLDDPRARRVSVRVIASSTRDVDAEVRAGRLLPELRDALAAARVSVPPLRERAADLGDLARTMLDELGSRAVLDEPTLTRLRAHRWPGNLVELKQVLARAIATSASGELHVALAVDSQAGATATLRDERDKFERDKLVELLRAHDDNVSAAARAAGIDRRHLHRLLKKHGLRGSSHPTDGDGG